MLSHMEKDIKAGLMECLTVLEGLDLAQDRTMEGQSSLMRALGRLEVKLQHYTKVVVGSLGASRKGVC